MEEIISAENLNFSYGENQAVTNVSFSVKRGDYVALVGHNGSGKSTLIKLLLGIIRPADGRVALFGKSLHRFSGWAKIGYLPQNIGLFNPLFPATVFEVVALGLIAQKQFPKRLNQADFKKVTQALKQLDISQLSHKLIGELSGGQIQRTLLARAIVNQPELLILDEPVSSIDTETREEFFTYTAQLNQQKQTTIILVTHDIAHSGGFANKLMFMDKQLIFYGSFGEFAASVEMQSYLGKEIHHIISHQH